MLRLLVSDSGSRNTSHPVATPRPRGSGGTIPVSALNQAFVPSEISNLPLSQQLLGDYHKLFERKTEILSNASIVLIVAYMRTGSTLTGSIFQEYPGTFYAFEPIRAVFDAFEAAQKHNRTTVGLKFLQGDR